MPTAFAVRLTVEAHRLYQDDSDLMSYLVAKFDTVIMYEHIGKKTEKKHVHLLLFDDLEDIITADAIKKSIQFKRLGISGADLSFKTSYKAKGVVHKIDRQAVPRYIRYMAKGELEPEFVSEKSYWDWKFCMSQIGEWEVIEPSEMEKLYESYKTYVRQNPKQIPDYPDYNHLSNITTKFCMDRHKFFSKKMVAERYMLFSTYVYYNNVEIPDKKKSPYDI